MFDLRESPVRAQNWRLFYPQRCDEDTPARLLQMQSHCQLLPSQLTIRSYRKGVMAVQSLEITSGHLSLVGCHCCSLSLILVVLWAKGIALLGRTVLMSSSLQWWQEALPLFPRLWHNPFSPPEGSEFL